MAEDDSGIIFGDPDIGVGFGNPDAPNPIGFGIPFKQAKVRKCATVIRCPGTDFLNYSTECDDVDYAGGTILKCLDQATPIDFFVKAPGIGPWTWDVQNLPDGVMYLVNDFCPSLLNIFGILTSDQTTTTIITVTDGFGNVTVMKITFSTSTVGPCHIVDPTPIICTEEPCPGPGDSFTIELCDGTEQVYSIPADATPEQVLEIQQQAADAYYRSLLACRDTTLPPNVPPPNILWYNQSQTWTDTCPDGSFFFYTVGANRYASNTLLNANTKALLSAKKQADKLFICISPDTLPDGKIGVPYSELLTPSGGTALYTFTIDSGALPPGLTIIDLGLISGTPTTSGTYPFIVKVIDSSNPQKSLTKPYTINITSLATLSAYWTLNESTGNRADSVQNIQWIPLAPVGGPFTSHLSDGAALFINGLRLTGSGGAGDGRIFTNDEPGLATTGNGMSIAGWFRVNGTPAGGDVLPQLILSVDTMLTSGNISLQLCSGYTNNNGIVGGSDVNSNSASLPFTFTTGIWNFFCIVYDASAQLLRFQLNGGAQSSFGSGMQYPASTTGALRLFCASIFASGMDVQYDEIAVSVNGPFSAAQIAYLYNGGAGRSWPIVLP